MSATEYRKLVVIVWLVIVAAMAALWGNDAWHGTRWDIDDFMRLVEVRDFVSGQSWYDLTQYRLNPPGGTAMHWARIIDLPLAAITLALSPFLALNDALVVAAMIVPPLYLLPFLIAYATTARLMLGSARSPIGLLAVIAGSNAMVQFAPGRVDHHGPQLVMVITAVSLLLIGLSRPRWRKLIPLAGIPMALSVWIGIEMLPLLAAWFAVLGLVWCWIGGNLARQGALAAGLGALIGLVALPASVRADLWLAPVCDAFSIVPVSAFALIAIGFGAMDLLGRRISGIAGRVAIAAVCGALAAGAFIMAFPSCLQLGLSDLDPVVKQFWLNNVVEALPLSVQFRIDTFIGLDKLWPSTLALAYALWQCLRGRRRARVLWGAMALMVAFSGALMLWQVRASTSAHVIALVPLAGLIADLWRRIRGHRPRLQQFALLLPVIFVCSAAFWPAVSAAYRLIPSPKPAGAVAMPGGTIRQQTECISRDPLPVLAAAPPALILSYIDLGPMLMFTTPHAVLGAPYHRNNGGLKETISLFRASDDAWIRDELKRRGVTWIVICPGPENRTAYRTKNGDGFAERLAAGQVPDYLTEVREPARPDLKMYRVTP